MKEHNAYILGTDTEELHRLGVQHQVWAEEAQRGWNLAGFKAGETFLDLGSGPGFCTKELAYIAGEHGKVIGVDRSAAYIEHLKQVTALHHLNIEPVLSDFDEMVLEPETIDGMYCRWALAWLPNPKEILINVRDALKHGGRMVIHEYYDWSTHQTEPQLPGLNKAIAAALRSFKDSEGHIDIGRELPRIFEEIGMKVTGVRLMSKLAKPDNLIWQWPKTFYHSYFPRLAEAGFLEEQDVKHALQDMSEIESLPYTTLCCPLMVEVIAEKV